MQFTKKTKVASTVGSGAVVILITYLTFFMGDYRDILAEYPDASLILISKLDENDQALKIELLARSYNPDIEFIRWKYEEDRLNLYYGRNLIDSSYWQVFQGTSGVFFNEKKPITYIIEDVLEEREGDAVDWYGRLEHYKINEKIGERVKIIYEIDYFFDSRHTSKAGTLIREVEVYPVINKETITWTPATTDRFNFKYIHETKDGSPQYKITDNTSYNFQDLIIDWTDSSDKVSNVWHYANGKLVIRYISAAGNQIIDPTIEQKTILNVEQATKEIEVEKIVGYETREFQIFIEKIDDPMFREHHAGCLDYNSTHYLCNTTETTDIIKKVKVLKKQPILKLSAGKVLKQINFSNTGWNCRVTSQSTANCEFYEGDGIYHSGEFYLFINLTKSRTYLTYLNSLEPLECEEYSLEGRDYTICIDKSIKGALRENLLFDIK